jgi:hypothetical protein
MYQKHIFKRFKIAYKMYNFTMRHHFCRPQAMFLIMDHCSIVTVGRLDHTFGCGPSPKRVIFWPLHCRGRVSQRDDCPVEWQSALMARGRMNSI